MNKFFLASVALVFVSACSNGDDTNPQPDSSMMMTYASGCVGTCVAMTCAAEITTCNADPTCAAYFACVDQCGTTSSGDADPTCVSKCPAVTGTAGTSAQTALDGCREHALTGACASCNGGTNDDGGSIDGGTCVPGPELSQTCSPDTDTDVCIKCQYEKCCNSVNAVFNGGPATDYANCWLACTGSDAGVGPTQYACIQGCEQQFPSGVQGFGQYEACLRVECEATKLCVNKNACATCSYQNCGCEYAACVSDPDCYKITECQDNCTTVACTKACTDNATAGYDLAFAYGICASQRCLTQCGQ